MNSEENKNVVQYGKEEIINLYNEILTNYDEIINNKAKLSSIISKIITNGQHDSNTTYDDKKTNFFNTNLPSDNTEYQNAINSIQIDIANINKLKEKIVTCYELAKKITLDTDITNVINNLTNYLKELDAMILEREDVINELKEVINNHILKNIPESQNQETIESLQEKHYRGEINFEEYNKHLEELPKKQKNIAFKNAISKLVASSKEKKEPITEVFDDNSKRVTDGNIVKNYDNNGNLLSTVEVDDNGIIINIIPSEKSALERMITITNEDGSKIVTRGNTEFIYDANGKLKHEKTVNEFNQVVDSKDSYVDATGKTVIIRQQNEYSANKAHIKTVITRTDENGKKLVEDIKINDTNGLREITNNYNENEEIVSVNDYRSSANYITHIDYAQENGHVVKDLNGNPIEAKKQQIYGGIPVSIIERNNNGDITNIQTAPGVTIPGIQTEYFEDSKRITDGNKQYNIDINGNLSSTIETIKENDVTIIKENTREGSEFKNSTTKIYNEDGSKSVTIGNVTQNYDGKGNLLSTIEVTGTNDSTITTVTTAKGSRLQDSIITKYDDGSTMVKTGNVTKNYNNKGELTSTIETTNEDGIVTTNIIAGTNSALQNSTIITQSDGSKKIIMGNIIRNYDKDGKLISMLDSTKTTNDATPRGIPR